MIRPHALPRVSASAIALFALSARAAPTAPPAPSPPINATLNLGGGVDGGFRLEPRPAIDDVFGDSNDYRRIVDRFSVLGDNMQKTRDDFARAVQVALAAIAVPPGAKEKRLKCPEKEVAGPYARALRLGRAYLAAGRELSRHYEQVRDFDRLGESLGLTPDYRAKVKKVMAQYNALLVDYREMKVAFHDELSDELRYAGCDLDKLVALAATTPAEAQTPVRDEAWPSPNELLPPPPEGAEASAKPGEPAAATDRSGILFYVDNTRCSAGTSVTLDGHPLGDVPGATRTAFQATPGPHDLCLLPTNGSSGRKCGEPGTIRRNYLHEGWTISLRCE